MMVLMVNLVPRVQRVKMALQGAVVCLAQWVLVVCRVREDKVVPPEQQVAVVTMAILAKMAQLALLDRPAHLAFQVVRELRGNPVSEVLVVPMAPQGEGVNEVSRALPGAQDFLETLEKTDHRVLEVYRVFLVYLATLAERVQLVFQAQQALMAFQVPKVYQVNLENLEQQVNLVLRVKPEHLEVPVFLVPLVKKARKVHPVKQDLLVYRVFLAKEGLME